MMKNSKSKRLSRNRFRLRCYFKPTGLSILKQASLHLKRNISIWKNRKIIQKLGSFDKDPKIDLQFLPHYPSARLGHWRLKNEPRNQTNKKCLFELLAQETGTNPYSLRKDMLVQLKPRPGGGFSTRRCSPPRYKPTTKYFGTCSADARRVLDDSQMGRSHPCGNVGHPRAHASHPDRQNMGYRFCVEKYSMGLKKTGFLSYSDQDEMAHLALSCPEAKKKMRELIEGADEVTAYVDVEDFGVDVNCLPKIGTWYQGKKLAGVRTPEMFVLNMRHHQGKKNVHNWDVFVHNFLPKWRKRFPRKKNSEDASTSGDRSCSE